LALCFALMALTPESPQPIPKPQSISSLLFHHSLFARVAEWLLSASFTSSLVQLSPMVRGEEPPEGRYVWGS
jgi:hypothetical protein